MRFQKTIRKIIALGTTAAFMGTTLMTAAHAADLANYPTQFVENGVFNGFLVVGDTAASQDVIGITDIAISLQHASVKAVETTTGALTPEGDVWKATTSTKILELTEEWSIGSAVETLRNISTRLTTSDLDALKSGEITNNKGTSPYNQYLYLLGPGADTTQNTGYVSYLEDSDTDISADFLYFKSGKEIGRYLLEFTTALESDVDDSAGSSSSTGLFLTDFQDVDVNFLGKTYSIVTAKRTTTVGNNVVLTLMGGAKKDTLLEDGTRTYNINGKDYEVTLNFVDADEAQFTINGVASRKLKDGDSDRLFSGTANEVTIGVSDILYQDYAGGIHSSTFFIGAQKVELKDALITDVASSNALKVDDETIDDATVIIEGTDNNSTFKITRIHVNMTADDDFYVPAGGKLSENINLDEPQVLFTNNWDIEYKGLSEELNEEIRITTSGTKRYNLKFKDGDGNDVEMPLVEAVAASALEFGEKDKSLINAENRTIRKDDYLILTDGTENRGERKTYVLQYKGADKITADSPVLKFKNLGSKETIEQTYSNTTTGVVGASDPAGGSELATLKLGGADFKVYADNSIADNDFNILVDLDASGTVTASKLNAPDASEKVAVNITTYYGMEVGIENRTILGAGGGDNTSSYWVISFKTPDNTRDGGSTRDSVETLQATDYVLNITSDSNGKVDLAETHAGFTSGQRSGGTAYKLNTRTPEGETDVSYAYTSYGTVIKHETPTSDPNTITIEYPKKQRQALVYVTTKGTTFSTTGVAEGETGVSQRIEVGAVRLASEVTDVKAQNTIIVGGPCANAAAATVMGVSMTFPACAEDFKANTGKIKLYEHANGKIAILVAGAAAADTREATTVLADYKDYKSELKGTELEVTKVQDAVVVAAPAMEQTTTTTIAPTTA